MNQIKTNIFFIINPYSGNQNKSRIINKISSEINKQIFKPEIIQTETIKQLSDILGIIKKDKDNIVVAVGGDGTINRIVNEIVNTNIRFGIIPRGSGNGLARELGIPQTISGAIRVINQFNFRKIDVLQLNNLYSVNVSGVGFDAVIAQKFANLKHRGFKHYIRITAQEIKAIKPDTYHLFIDEYELNAEVYLISFANSRQWGNNAYIAPRAKIDDGLIDVVLLHPFPLLPVPIMIAELFTKTLNHSPYIDTIKAKTVTIQKAGDIFAHVDGEPYIFRDKIDINIHHRKLQIMCPKFSQ